MPTLTGFSKVVVVMRRPCRHQCEATRETGMSLTETSVMAGKKAMTRNPDVEPEHRDGVPVSDRPGQNGA
jgi:hypothetical protein